jgi:hypothetical protein
MPTSRSVRERRGIIALWEIADRDLARLAVLIAILARRSMEPTGRGAASNIGQRIPILGVLATTTPSKGHCVVVRRPAFGKSNQNVHYVNMDCLRRSITKRSQLVKL